MHDPPANSENSELCQQTYSQFRSQRTGPRPIGSTFVGGRSSDWSAVSWSLWTSGRVRSGRASIHHVSDSQGSGSTIRLRGPWLAMAAPSPVARRSRLGARVESVLTAACVDKVWRQEKNTPTHCGLRIDDFGTERLLAHGYRTGEVDAYHHTKRHLVLASVRARQLRLSSRR